MRTQSGDLKDSDEGLSGGEWLERAAVEAATADVHRTGIKKVLVCSP